MDPQISQYYHLLTTNTEPTSVEADDVQRVIIEREAAFLRFDSRIIELQNRLDSLVKRCDDDEMVLSRFRAIFSPIRRLPRDILIEVFLFTRDGKYDTCTMGDLKPIPVGPRPGQSPLLITHVCSKWRTIALSVPMLWNTITLDNTGYSRLTDSPEDIQLETWLERTGPTAPLDITVIKRYEAIPVSWMQPYIHRISTLSLVGINHRLPSGSFDVLEMLRVDISDSYHDVSINMDAISTPSLRRLCFRGRAIPPLSIPWRQLTHVYLDIRSSPLTSFFHILSDCKVLRHLDISMSEMYTIGGDANLTFPLNKHIVMARLQTLTIRSSPAMYWLMLHLTLPALTTLGITYRTFPVTQYDSFQQRSSFHLQSLTLWGSGRLGVAMEPAYLLNIISRTPSLTEIIAYDTLLITPLLISGLTSNNKSGIPDLGPNLEYLGVCNSLSHRERTSITEADDDAVLAMITSRDLSQRQAVIEANPPSSYRVFRSPLPKRSCNGKLKEFTFAGNPYNRGKGVHIYF